MPYKIQITKINQPSDATSAAAQTESKVYEQQFDDVDLPALVLALNKRPRVRKSRTAAAKQDKS